MVLLTGASGFLGEAISKSFPGEVITIGRSRHGISDDIVRHVSFDLSTNESTHELIKQLEEYKLTAIIHAAAVTPWSKDPDFSQDLQIAKNIVAICDGLNLPNFYFLSGWVVYKMLGSAPFSEKTPIGSTTPYGSSKLTVEDYLNKTLKGTHLVNLRLASVYGPGQTSPGLIPNLVNNAFTNKRLSLQAKETRRDYLYIQDLMKAMQDLQTIVAEGSFNLGSGTSISVFEVAQTIQAICHETYNFEVPIEFEPDIHEAEPLDNRLSIDKAKSLGLLSKTTNFKTGLETYIAWRKHEGLL